MAVDPEKYAEALAGLESRDDKIVIASSHKLGDFGERRAVPHLIQTMMTTENPAVRDAAAMGLRDLEDHAAVPFIVSLLKDPKTEGYRSTLVHALQTLDPFDELPFLVQLVIEGGWEVRREALVAIEEIESPVPGKVLRKVRAAAREAADHATGDDKEVLLDLCDVIGA